MIARWLLLQGAANLMDRRYPTPQRPFIVVNRVFLGGEEGGHGHYERENVYWECGRKKKPLTTA